MFFPTWIIMLLLVGAAILARLDLWLRNPDHPVRDIVWWELAFCIFGMIATLVLNGRGDAPTSIGLFAFALGMALFCGKRLRDVHRKRGWKPRG